MTQLEFYKSFQFVLELLLAELLFVNNLRRRPFFALRVMIGVGTTFLFSWFIPVLSSDAFYCSFMFLAIFIITVLAGKFIFKESWIIIVFCCIAGYTTQHLTYEIYSLSLILMGANTPMGFYGSEFVGMFSNFFLTAVYFCVYVLSYFFSFLFFGTKLKKHETLKFKATFIFMFAIFILIVDIFLNAVVVYYLSSNGEDLYMIVIGVYNMLCCIVALYLQFEVVLRRSLEVTLDTAHQMLGQVKEQYAISKENIELINMKCHDLKHHIRSVGSSNMISSSVLKEMEDHISIYDSAVKTGNNALDIILTEKSLLCNKNKIRLSCIVDGEKLNFMAEEDIYALFGNIVDNSIEAVLKLEPQNRVISLQVKAIEDMLTIKAYNYFKEDIIFENEIPQTTKENKNYHGFGIKSIRYICEKYDGDLTIKAVDDVFYINILFFM